MISKFGLALAILLFLQIFSLSIVNAQEEDDTTEMEHDPSKDFSELLKYENKLGFYTNQGSGDFINNFEQRKIRDPSDYNIIIKSGTTINLEGSPSTREYSTILVEGDLRIINTGDSSLRVQKIIIAPSGSLTIGDKENPIKHDEQVDIVFVKNEEGEVGIFVFGKLEIYGKELSSTFVGLENSVRSGEKRLLVNEELENWEVGDTVVITSPGIVQCNEIAELSRVDSPYIFLKDPLNCDHRVISDTENSIISHVALLSRNVKISSDDKNNRGTVTFFHGSTGNVKYAQFDLLGPKEVLGRYPIHFHHLLDTSRGIEVIGNSITNSDNRWVTIHDSNGILVKNNVGYISQGHGFFLEDGTEFDNVFEKNIGIITKSELISRGASSVFWTQNPMNVYRENVAVNGQYWGFFFQIPHTVVDLPNSVKQFSLRSLPSLEFEDNTAYNNGIGGMHVSRHTLAEDEIPSSEIIISNFHSMNSRGEKPSPFGIQVSGSNVTISNSNLMNHRFGVYLGGENNKVIDTKIIMKKNMEPDTEISGILIVGSNNLIENSEIEGYVSSEGNRGSDISISNDQRHKRLLSAKIINTRLLDPLPIYFGDPANENSFLEVYGYDAPFSPNKRIPQDFMLKKIGTEVIEERGEYVDNKFDAMIKMIPKTKSENQLNASDETQIDYDEITKSLLTKTFKNKALNWEKNKLSDKGFLNEIEILFESRVFEIEGVGQGSFQEIQFNIPKWVKQLIGFWSEDSISDQEFINAIKFILESKLDKAYN